jgi:hypothetical protein
VVDETVVKIFTSQVGITSSSLDLENTLLNGKERDIKGSSSKIENENIAFPSNLLVETVGDGSRCRFVDDTEDVETRDGSGVLGCLTLGVVEVGGDSDNSIANSRAKVRLCSFPHLGEDH